jgi:hypothetical protein
MEDIIHKLRESAAATAFPLELPTEDDLIEIEEALCTPLPDDYKVFLLEVSDLIVGRLEPATAADPSMHTYLPEIASRAWENGISRELLPFCEDGEDVYCITMNNRVIKAQMFDYNEIDEEDGWSSIWEWAELVWLNQ